MDLPCIHSAVNTSLMKSSSSNTNGNSGTRKACGACRERRRKCDSSCVFADVIPHDEPHKYRELSETYNIKWVELVLSHLSQSQTRRFVVERLLDKDGHILYRRLEEVCLETFTGYRDVSGGGTKRRSQPCGACKEKKCECKSSCVFAGAIPYKEPEKYVKLNKVFNIKWVEKILLPLNDDQRVEVVNLFLSEADTLKELPHSLLLGCENHICPGVACPPHDVGQQDLGLMDYLPPFSQQYQLESWGGIILS